MPSMSARDPVMVGDWRVDPAIDTVSKGSESQKLEPRTMRLLMRLVDSGGAVVSQDQLLTDVWAGVIVGTASVYQAVSQLRKILGDTDPHPTYIATVPRKGYRLVAAVRPLNAADSSPDDNAIRPAPPPALPRKTPRWMPFLVALSVLGTVTWIAFHRSPTPAPPSSVVVLPFVDMTATKSDQFFCDGLTEELSNWLAQIPTLRVVARTSAFSYKGQGEDVRQIGKTLDINHVIEGSMRRFGDRMRVTVQLIDAHNGYHLWSANYDRPISDTIQMQEDISRSVAQSLQIPLTQNTADRFTARRSSNPQAYELYLLAHHSQMQRTRDSTERAIAMYRQILDLDPKFALADVGLGFALLNQGYFNNRPTADVAAEVEPLIAAALRIDPNLSDAYAVRGALRHDQYRIGEALDDLRRAVGLNPNDSAAYAEMGRILLVAGRPREALASFNHAVSLDPLEFRPEQERCTALTDMARYDEAATACQRAHQLAPESSLPLDELAWLAEARGHIDEALQWNAASIQAEPDNFDRYWLRADLYLEIGLASPAREAIDKGRAATRDTADADAALAQVMFCESGSGGLRGYLTATLIDRSPHAITLMEAAYSRLVLGEGAAARDLVQRALAAPDVPPGLDDSPWYARTGVSYRLKLATAELQLNDAAAASHELQLLRAMLDQMIASGVERHGVYELRAKTLALLGNPDAAMRDLAAAEHLGWRRTWAAEHEPYLAGLRSRDDYRALIDRVTVSNRQMVERVKTSPPLKDLGDFKDPVASGPRS